MTLQIGDFPRDPFAGFSLLVLIGVVIAVAFVLSELALRRESIDIIMLAGGVTLLITAIWFVVAYFRTLTLLQAAMSRSPPRRRAGVVHSGVDAIQR